MEKTVNQRLKKFVESKEFSAKEFAERFGANAKEINNWTTSTKIALPRLSELILAYPELNVRWLLTGQGKMTDEAEKENELNDKKHEYLKECPLCKTKNELIDSLRHIIQLNENRIKDLEHDKERLEKDCSDKEMLLDFFKGKKETAADDSAQHRQAANE